MDDPGAGYGFESDHTYEGDWFYFHTDHIGSTSYLTDTVGNVSQFVWYAPYGEALVDEHTTTYENPFKFSGKELDDITGLYDHGARNRNPITAVWYGIDELFENDPDKSPFHYCGGNPVRFVDPDGREIEKNSLQEWKQNVEAIENRKNELSQQLVKLESSSNLSRRMKKESYLLRERITFLDVKLNNLKAMEEDNKTIISLNKLPENQDGNNMGWIEKKDGRIIVNYYNTENFVHETTHITQFMEGNLAFSIDGMVVARDIYDEIHAYMMQCAYSDEQYLSDITPTFVKKLPSPSRSFYTNKNGYSNLPLGADTPGFILKRGFSDSPEMIKSYFPFNTLKEQFRGQWEFYVK